MLIIYTVDKQYEHDSSITVDHKHDIRGCFFNHAFQSSNMNDIFSFVHVEGQLEHLLAWIHTIPRLFWPKREHWNNFLFYAGYGGRPKDNRHSLWFSNDMNFVPFPLIFCRFAIMMHKFETQLSIKLKNSDTGHQEHFLLMNHDKPSCPSRQLLIY